MESNTGRDTFTGSYRDANTGANKDTDIGTDRFSFTSLTSEPKGGFNGTWKAPSGNG